MQDKPHLDGRGCMVILGASYARAWKIEELLGCQIINNGIDGNQSFEMQQRFERDVVMHKPDYVLIWGFINDIFRSDPDKLDSAILRIRESFISMVNIARQQDIEPILATEVTIREKAGISDWIMSIVGRLLGKTSYQDYINGHVMEMNVWLRDYAVREGLKLLDFEKLLSDDDGSRQRPFATDDGSHLSAKAYETLTQYSEAQLILK